MAWAPDPHPAGAAVAVAVADDRPVDPPAAVAGPPGPGGARRARSAPDSSNSSTRSGAGVQQVLERPPRIRIRGAKNMTSNASLTRTTVPSASTMTTPSARDSISAFWRRSTARGPAPPGASGSVMSRRVTTIPPTGSSRWLAACSSRSISCAVGRRARQLQRHRQPATGHQVVEEVLHLVRARRLEQGEGVEADRVADVEAEDALGRGADEDQATLGSTPRRPRRPRGAHRPEVGPSANGQARVRRVRLEAEPHLRRRVGSPVGRRRCVRVGRRRRGVARCPFVPLAVAAAVGGAVRGTGRRSRSAGERSGTGRHRRWSASAAGSGGSTGSAARSAQLMPPPRPAVGRPATGAGRRATARAPAGSGPPGGWRSPG